MQHCTQHGSLLAEQGLRLFSLLLLMALVQPFAVSRQQAHAAPSHEMRKLDFLLGEWKGKGWRYVYGGARVEFSQSVKVKSEPDGASLRAGDKRTYKNDLLGSVPASTATISYEEGAQLYQVRMGSSKGRENPFAAKLIEPRTLQWEKQTPVGIIRTTIEITVDDEWHETLEFWNSVDGWYKAEESVLKRVK